MHTDIWLNITPQDLERRLKGIFRRLVPEIFEVLKVESSLKGAEIMREEVPVRRGLLRDSIRIIRLPDGFRVLPTIYYAGIVLAGAPPHMILPRKGRYLRFITKEGIPVVARKVKHPGYPGNPYIDRTSKRLTTFIRRRVHELFRSKVK